MNVELKGFEKKELKNISGKAIYFKGINIPDEDCSAFLLRYELKNQNSGEVSISPIQCLVSPYQRDVTQVSLNKVVKVPQGTIFSIQLESKRRIDFNGSAYIEYELINLPIEKTGKTVFITEANRQNAYRIALINLAQFFKIPEWEYKKNNTLYEELKSTEHPIIELLESYFNAYDEWFNFYQKIKKIETAKGTRHELSDKEKRELFKLAQKREKTLNTLQEKFDELQFKQFQENHGLDNVDGIIR